MMYETLGVIGYLVIAVLVSCGAHKVIKCPYTGTFEKGVVGIFWPIFVPIWLIGKAGETCNNKKT